MCKQDEKFDLSSMQLQISGCNEVLNFKLHIRWNNNFPRSKNYIVFMFTKSMSVPHH